MSTHFRIGLVILSLSPDPRRISTQEPPSELSQLYCLALEVPNKRIPEGIKHFSGGCAWLLFRAWHSTIEWIHKQSDEIGILTNIL